MTVKKRVGKFAHPVKTKVDGPGQLLDREPVERLAWAKREAT